MYKIEIHGIPHYGGYGMELICPIAMLFVPFGFAAWRDHGNELFLQEFMLQVNSYEERELQERKQKCLEHKIKQFCGLAVALAGTVLFLSWIIPFIPRTGS